jgi:hypothetical protein
MIFCSSILLAIVGFEFLVHLMGNVFEGEHFLLVFLQYLFL